MPLILSGNVASATAAVGYDVANSCRFNDGDSAFMSKTQGTGTNTTKMTLSVWIKRGALGTEQQIFETWNDNNNRFDILFKSSTDQLEIQNTLAGATTINLKTDRVFRDPAWMNIVVIVDSTQGTAANRVKLYINGTQETSFATETYLDEDANLALGTSSYTNFIGKYSSSGGNFFDGYMAEVVYLDGTAASIGDLGEFDDDSPTIWKPKDVSELTFGNNGAYLDFEASDNLGNDANGGTDLTEANLAATDQSSDSPTNNFATMNPLIIPTSGSSGGLSEGNLNITTVVQNCGTIFINKDSTGKWYWECKVISGNSSGKTAFGFSSDKSIRNDGGGTWAAENTLWLYSTDGSRYGSNAGWTGSAGDTYTDGDIIGMALDLNGDSMTFYKNGSSQFTISSLDISGTAIVPWVQNEVSGCVISANFGNPSYANSSSVADGNGYGAFEYAVPSGHYALCTKNLAEFGG